MWNTLKRLTNWLDEILNPGNDKARLEFARVALNEAIAQLAQAEIELADKAFYVREFAAVSAERDGLQKRNDVQAEQLRRLDSEISPLMAENADLRERASVPVPAGVPEIRAPREIGINAYLMHEQAKRENAGCIVGPMEAAATAIRDAVLTGVAGEQTVTMIGKPLTADTFGPNDGIAPTDDQVEALARVFRDEHAKVMGTDALSYGLTLFCAYARVAIAHLATRPALEANP